MNAFSSLSDRTVYRATYGVGVVLVLMSLGSVLALPPDEKPVGAQPLGAQPIVGEPIEAKRDTASKSTTETPASSEEKETKVAPATAGLGAMTPTDKSDAKDIPATEDNTTPARVGDSSRDTLVTLRWLGGAALVLAVLVGLYTVHRRRRGLWSAGEGRRLEILERLPLSGKHWVCLLRVDGHKLVVGMTPDNLRTLALFESKSGAGGTVPVSDEPGSKGDSGFWFRPSTDADEESSGTDRKMEFGDDLAPYRREVTRLRAMLQNWNQDPGTERNERSDR